MTVSRVDIHHEGSGEPSSDLDRFATGGYVLGIGAGTWKIFRRDVDNWATAHFNHVDLAVCFSGDRMTFPITDDDLRCLREALAEERRRGEIVDHPDVHPHGTLYTAPGGNLPGSSPTQCPGLLSLQRWPEIVAACQAATAPAPNPVPVQKVVPIMYSPALHVAAVLQDTPQSPARAGVAPDGSVFVWDASLGYHGGANGKAYFAGRIAARLQYPSAAQKAAGKVYVIIDTTGHPYAYPE